MRRAAIAAGALLAASLQAAPAASETAVGIGEREFSLSLYRERVRPGVVKFNIANLGEDRHNLAIRGPGRSRRVNVTSPDVRAGERLTFRVRLRATGRYTVVCTIADHEARGMRARLTVSKRAG